jgi:hypothetical protein
MHRRGDAVASPVGPHSGHELGETAEHGSEREQELAGVRGAVPAGQVRGHDERRAREAEQPENRRRGDRLQEDARARVDARRLAGRRGGAGAGESLLIGSCRHGGPPWCGVLAIALPDARAPLGNPVGALTGVTVDEALACWGSSEDHGSARRRSHPR